VQYGVVRRNQGGHGTLPVTIVGQSNADGENVFAPEGRVAIGGAGSNQQNVINPGFAHNPQH